MDGFHIIILTLISFLQSYYAYYTGQTWGEPKNYDLMINTSKISLEKAADLIIKYIELQQQDCK